MLPPGPHPQAHIHDTNKAVPVKVTWMVNHPSQFLLFTDMCETRKDKLTLMNNGNSVFLLRLLYCLEPNSNGVFVLGMNVVLPG